MPNTSTARPIPLRPNISAVASSKASRLARLRAGPSAGLSRVHNSPPVSQTLKVARAGAYVRVKNPQGSRPPADRKPRSKITRYTAHSRSRLIQSIAKMRRDVAPPNIYLITLTYPAEYPTDAGAWHRHLDTFLKRWRRRFPRSFGWWKLEPQKRGAPHFHLLVRSWGGRDKAWLSRTWYDVVGSGDLRHFRAGTNWEIVRSQGQVANYAAKYVGKLPEGAPWESPGRFWGVFARAQLPVAELTIQLDEWEFVRLRRLMRRQLRKKSGYHLAGGSRSGCWVGWSESEVRRVFAYLQDLRRFLLGYPIELRP